MHLAGFVFSENIRTTFSDVTTFPKAGQNNIVVSCNPTDPWQKAQTQKIYWQFSAKVIIRLISEILCSIADAKKATNQQ